MSNESIEQTLAAIRKARESTMLDPRLALFKDANSTFHQSGSPTSGLTFYDLEAGAKFLYPVLTPLRNSIPRVSGKGGIQASWRAVTGVNVSGMRIGVSGGNRGGIQAISTKDYVANYKGIGLEGNVDFEAQYAGQGFDDIRAINTKTLLEALMIGEEQMILGGNSSLALRTTPLPALADATTGGLLLNSTAYYVTCVALSLDGFLNASISSTGVQGSITRTNADASSDTFGGGAAKVSAEATITTSGVGSNTHAITASLAAPVLGATGYAWYLGTATTVERIVALTSAPTVVLTAIPAVGNQLSSALGTADNSTNALAFDGLLYQALAPGSGAYVQAVSSTFTADNAGGIVEIETMLKNMWDVSRLGPDTIWVNSQQALDISKKILAGGASGAQRFVFNSTQDALNAGVMVRTYLNRYSMAGGSSIDIKIHPNLPAGTVLATSNKLPYPMSNVGNVFQIRARQDYYQMEWPLRSRKWESGVYADEVLQHFFPPSMGVLYDVRAG